MTSSGVLFGLVGVDIADVGSVGSDVLEGGVTLLIAGLFFVFHELSVKLVEGFVDSFGYLPCQNGGLGASAGNGNLDMDFNLFGVISVTVSFDFHAG